MTKMSRKQYATKRSFGQRNFKLHQAENKIDQRNLTVDALKV
jgi:hypothetical protein